MDIKKLAVLFIIVITLGTLMFSKKHLKPNISQQQIHRFPAIESVQEISEIHPSKNPETYEEALQIAKKENKKILLYFTASWCPPCQKMKRETLKNEEVKKALSKFVVFYAEESDLSSKFGVRAIPTFKIINPEEKVEKTATGFMDVSKFLSFLGA